MLVAACVSVAGAAAAADGAALYKAKCSMCHGAGGEGTAMGNALKGNDFVTAGSEKAIADVILKGRSGAAARYKQFSMGMPAMKLNDADVNALAQHLKSLASE